MRYALYPLLIVVLGSCHILGGRDEDNAVALNTVVRVYGKSAPETWSAVQSVLKEMDLGIDKDRHDALGGNLVARRPNKDEIHVEARSQDADNTQLSVSVDPGDRNMAEIIQNRVSEKLGMNLGGTRIAHSAGSQVDGTYDHKLNACVTAAEEVVKELKLAPPRREVHDTWARLDSQHLDSIPVQFRMERTRKDQTFVVFMAGTSSTDDNRMLAQRMKAEFERHLPVGEGRP